MILKTTTGGFTSIQNHTSHVLPENFILYQNFPNPFNPSTSIKYLMEKSANIRIRIFNSAGVEVEELINEFRKPGTYSLRWDASNYPSGVYFYKMETNDFFSVSRSMILLK